MKIVLWDVIPFIFIKICHHFGEICFLHDLDTSVTLKMVNLNQRTKRLIAEDTNIIVTTWEPKITIFKIKF